MTLPTVFPLTDILWLAGYDRTIETAGSNGDRHAQGIYWTDGDFLPGRPQHGDAGMAWRDEALYCCCCHRDGFHTLRHLSARRVTPAPRQPDTARASTPRRPSGRRFYLYGTETSCRSQKYRCRAAGAIDIDPEQGVVTLQSFPDILRAFVFIQRLTTTGFAEQLVYARFTPSPIA